MKSALVRTLAACLGVVAAGCGSRIYIVSPPADVPATDAPAGDAAVVTCPLPGGGTCAVGQRCPAGDGCNTCSCGSDGRAACTLLGCVVDAGPPDTGPRGCVLPDGSPCADGQTCPAGDGCNDCTCTAGMLACTARPCAADAGPPLVDCAPEHTRCGGIPRMCPPGEVNVIEGACWGACVPFEACAPIDCTPTSPGYVCPLHTACDPAAGHCVLTTG